MDNKERENHSKRLKPLKDYVAIGFDLDHCLVRYNLKEFLTIPYESYMKVLKDENSHHHDELSDLNTKEISFMQNGLVIDMHTGNILKLGKDLLILKAFHGFKKLSDEELEKTYGKPAKFEKFDIFNVTGSDYFACLTYFQNQIPPFFAKLVEIHERNNEKLTIDDYKNIVKTIMNALNKNYHHYNQQICHPVKEYGYYFKEVLDNKDKHLLVQTKMLEVLKHLKAQGKVLFIVSNSHYEPTHELMEYAYGPDWRDLFSFVISKAHKPQFWTKNDHLFREINNENPDKLGKEVTVLESNQTYLEGNAKILEENIDRVLGKKEGSILYLGDNYVSDCIIAEKLHPRWNTVCIIEELEGVDFGELYDEKVFGDYFSDNTTEHGEVETFWWNYVRHNVTAVTSAVDSKEMLEFYYQKE